MAEDKQTTQPTPVDGPVAEGPAGAPAAAPAAAGAELADALAAKTAELERLQERLLRLQAEFENWKKRSAREKADFLKFANEELLLTLLPVLDNLDRAIASAPAQGPCGPLREGVEMTARLFRGALERAGVRPVEAVGQPFDPGVHQAVAQVEAPGEENRVVEEVQKGYLLEGRVLRPAMVKVSRAASRNGEGPEGHPA
ncbi:MAG: nucleotide exchange factor GrpE [Candidatus Methylomirabilales bacterium]